MNATQRFRCTRKGRFAAASFSPSRSRALMCAIHDVMSTWQRIRGGTVAVAQTVDELVQRHLVVVVHVHLLEDLLHVTMPMHSHLHVLRGVVGRRRRRLRDAIGERKMRGELIDVVDNILGRLHHELELLERDGSPFPPYQSYGTKRSRHHQQRTNPRVSPLAFLASKCADLGCSPQT